MAERILDTVNTSVQCHPTNYTATAIRNIEYIVLHYTGNDKDTALANARYFSSANRGASAHYFIDDTSVYRIMRDSDKAWAVGGTSKYKHKYCRNSNSLSVEMCTSGNRYVSELTRFRAAKLVAELCVKYGISDVDKYVLRHYDVWNKSCPAQFVTNPQEWIDFKNLVKDFLRGDDSPMTDNERKEFDKLKQELDNLKIELNEKNEEIKKIKSCIGGTMVYNYVDSNMPEFAHEPIKFFINNNIMKGDGGGLDLTYKDLRLYTVIYRCIKMIAKLINVKI